MDKLTEMHLLLREHGWEPEYEPPDHVSLGGWEWTRPGCDTKIFTNPRPHRREREPLPPYSYTGRFFLGSVHTHKSKPSEIISSVAELRRRLEQLGSASTLK